MSTYKFKLVSSDNLDALLEAIGVPEDRRKAIAGAEVTYEFSKDAEGYTVFTTTYGTNSFTNRYKVGEEFEYERAGKKIKALATKGEGHTYTIVEQHDGFEVTHVRTFNGEDELKQTTTAKGVTATQVFKKV